MKCVYEKLESEKEGVDKMKKRERAELANSSIFLST